MVTNISERTVNVIEENVCVTECKYWENIKNVLLYIFPFPRAVCYDPLFSVYIIL